MKVKPEIDIPKINSQHASPSYWQNSKRKVQNGQDSIEAVVKMYARVVNNELNRKKAAKLVAEQGNISEESCLAYFSRLNKKSRANKRASELAEKVLNKEKKILDAA